jgi:hypothetical protein
VLAYVEAAEAFARDGVVCLRSVLDRDQVTAAAEAIDAVLARPGPLAQVASAGDDPGAFTEDFCRWCPPTGAWSCWFEGLDVELAAGAAMDHPLFPVVWGG